MEELAFGPPPRDELAAWTTARLASTPLPTPPAYTAAPPRGRTVTVGGQDIFLRHTPGPGRQVWYLHGLEGSSRNWDRLAGTLAEVASSFAPDLPGSGRSAPARSGSYAIAREAALMAELIDREGAGPVDLVGNSRGGVVATYLAAQYPDRVRSLTLISPAVPDLRLVRDRGADPRLGLVMIPGMGSAVARQLSSLAPRQQARQFALSCFGEPDALSAADLHAAEVELAERARNPWAERATVASLRSLIRCYLAAGRGSFKAAARSVLAPTLIVWGTRDRLVDARLARPAAGLFRQARLLMLPRTGHVAQMERPIAVARAMLALWADMGAPESATAQYVTT